MTDGDLIDAIERTYRVNIEPSDTDGNTHVYTYTEDGDRLSFTFYTMNPDLDDVRSVAIAMDRMRVLADRRPRIGRCM